MNVKSIALVILGLVAVVALVFLVLLYKEEGISGDVARLYSGNYGAFSQGGGVNAELGGGCASTCSVYDQSDARYDTCYLNCLRTRSNRKYSLGTQQVGTA